MINYWANQSLDPFTPHKRGSENDRFLWCFVHSLIFFACPLILWIGPITKIPLYMQCFSTTDLTLFFLDINECNSVNSCDPNSECFNTYGSYYCSCTTGKAIDMVFTSFKSKPKAVWNTKWLFLPYSDKFKFHIV